MKLFLFLSDFIVPFILFVIIGYGILMTSGSRTGYILFSPRKYR